MRRSGLYTSPAPPILPLLLLLPHNLDCIEVPCCVDIIVWLAIQETWNPIHIFKRVFSCCFALRVDHCWKNVKIATVETRGVDNSRSWDASQCGSGRFCVAAETEHDRESAAYADCWLSGLRWTIKLCHNVAPMLWLWADIRLTLLDYLCRREHISGHMLYFMSLLGSTIWTRPTLTATSASHLPFSHKANVCSHK